MRGVVPVDLEEQTLRAARLVGIEGRTLKQAGGVLDTPPQTIHYRLRVILPRIDTVLAVCVDRVLVEHRRCDPIYLGRR